MRRKNKEKIGIIKILVIFLIMMIVGIFAFSRISEKRDNESFNGKVQNYKTSYNYQYEEVIETNVTKVKYQYTKTDCMVTITTVSSSDISKNIPDETNPGILNGWTYYSTYEPAWDLVIYKSFNIKDAKDEIVKLKNFPYDTSSSSVKVTDIPIKIERNSELYNVEYKYNKDSTGKTISCDVTISGKNNSYIFGNIDSTYMANEGWTMGDYLGAGQPASTAKKTFTSNDNYYQILMFTGSDSDNAVININIDQIYEETDSKYFTFELNETNKTAKITGIKDEYAIKSYYINYDNSINYNAPQYKCGIKDGDKFVTDVVIPSKIGEYIVTEIGDAAFGISDGNVNLYYWYKDNDNMFTSFKLPDTITKIGDRAFNGCLKLKNINIPSGITSIGSMALANCQSLTDVIIPNNITCIREYTFWGCTNLTNINIPSSVISIEKYAFCGCRSLVSIDIPNKVTSIGDWTFANCESLKNINIPNSITNIGEYAFSLCKNLTNIKISNNVTSMKGYVFYNWTENQTIDCTDFDSAPSGWDKNWNGSCKATIKWKTAANIPVTGITLNKTNTTLAINAKETLTATLSPTNATNKEITWESSNQSIVTVNNGEITAKGVGTATITAKTNDGGKTATCKVNVIKNENPTPSKQIINFKLDIPEQIVLKQGEEFAIPNGKITLYYSDGTTQEILLTKEELNKNGVTIEYDKTKLGKQKVVFHYNERTFELEVLVTEDGKTDSTILVTGVQLSKNEITLKEGDTETLEYTITPENATNKNVSWSSSDETVATVRNGMITAIKEGETTITVTTEDGNKTATCTVTVEKTQDINNGNGSIDNNNYGANNVINGGSNSNNTLIPSSNTANSTVANAVLPKTGTGRATFLAIIIIGIVGVISISKYKKIDR